MGEQGNVQQFLAAAAAAQARGDRAEAAEHLALAIDRHLATKEPLPRAAYYEAALHFYYLRRLDEAEKRARQGLQRQPKDFGLNNLLGVVLRNLGRFEEALRYLTAAQKIEPANIAPHVNKANCYIALRDGRRTAEALVRPLRAQPGNAEYQRLLGVAYRLQGDIEKALKQFELARRLDPRDIRGWTEAAKLLDESGRGAEALELVEQGLAQLGEERALVEGKVKLLRRAGRREEAETYAREIVRHLPGKAWAHAQLAFTVMAGDRPAANEHLRRAVELEPENPEYITELADSLDRTRGAEEGANIEKAYHLAKRRLALGGNLLESARTLRSLLHRSADYEASDSLGSFEALGDYWSRSGVAVALHHHLGQVRTPEHRRLLIEYHRRWGRMVDAEAAAFPIARPAVRTAPAKVRIGIMSSDLRHHPVSYFALPIIEGYDRSRFEIYCYSWNSSGEDAIQRLIASKVDAFRLEPGIADRSAAELIARDSVDMLFELGGTTAMNRLQVMAWRPARLQASWLGYPHSSGLGSIDYILVDPWLKPPDPALLIEKPFEMQRSWVVLGRLGFNDEHQIDMVIPEARQGRLTFGTMNNPYKYNPEVLSTWAEIVRRVEGSRFLFVRPEGATAPFRDNVRRIFEANGVAPDRVEFIAVRGTHMQHYNAIDIALDSFPQTGGTTTCETLWMGVPTVTLVGEAFFERLSYSNLTNAGLGELCAFDRESYIEIAVNLAADRAKREAWRHGLRDQIRQQPLGRADLFVQDFQDTVLRTLESHRP